MIRLVIKSWLLLLYFEFVMLARDFHTLHTRIADEPVRPAIKATRVSVAVLCQAMDMACVLYFKQVLCLQRSAATTVLVRRHGIPGQMIIGAQLLPFKSHAWVEVEQTVINDKPYMRELYQVLDLC